MASINVSDKPAKGCFSQKATPEAVFDVCENIRAGAELFIENYSRAAADFGPGRDSLVSALSAYNTGDFTSGVQNGSS
jgi:type IV secretion system protein VirB1